MRRVLTASDRAYLVEEDDVDGAMRLHAALADAHLPGVVELVPAARTVLVRFDPRRTRGLRDALRTIAPSDAVGAASGEVVLPVRYDGADLGEVADLLGVTVEELVARHAAATWRVAFTGFAPGFGYLVGDDPLFDVPRRATPRARVPAGSVGVAGAYSGVYPRESPGGWQLIGRTDAVLWDLDRDPAALLSPGTLVRFVDTERAEAWPAPAARAAASRPASGAGRGRAAAFVDMPGDRHVPHAVEIVGPGLQALVQDLGRPGFAHLGVSSSGAADRTALRAANRAVGNAPAMAGLEVLGGGAVLRFRGAGVVAFCGAAADGTLVHADDRIAITTSGRPFAVEDGDELTIGSPVRGVRTVIAIRGGIALTPAFGSLSSDTLGDIGPREYGGRALRAGDVLPLHGPTTVRGAVESDTALRDRAPAHGLVSLRVTLGPRDDWFEPASVRRLLSQEWGVTPLSDRVGIRLAGEAALERAVGGELQSEGTVTGSLQVPPQGQPVLFLPDRPVTGGYPVIAAVVDADLDLAGQLAPGMRVRFRLPDGDGPDVGGPS